MQQTVNPFTYGNPISDPKRFYGRKRELDQVFSRLMNAECESSSLVGEHRTGKSSFLLCMSHPEVVRQRGFDPDRYLFVYAHLDIISSSSTPSRFYQYVLRRIGSVNRDPELADLLRQLAPRDSIDPYDLEDVFDLVDRKGLVIVLLLDDFEHLASNANFGPEFYYGLRSLAVHHGLALVTASRSDLVELAHTDSVRSSPFFNIFATVNLEPFSPTDVPEFVMGSLAGTGVSFKDAEVERAVRIAGRQPFFLQIALHHLFDAARGGDDPAGRLSVAEEQFQAAAAPHFEGYWQRCSDDEKIALAVLGLLGQGYARKEPSQVRLEELFAGAGSAVSTLVRRGLAVRTPGGVAPFSDSFSRWVAREFTAPPKEAVSASKDKTEKALRSSLPSPIRAKAGAWLDTLQTTYPHLLARWLSDPRTAERALAFLESCRDAFAARELQPAGVAAEPGQTQAGPQLVSGPADEGSVLTEAERRSAARHLPPEGTVTILFTDLAESTTLFQALGDQRARELMRNHDRLIRRWIADSGGYEVKNTGDGFMVVFPSARRALECTIGIQRELETSARESPAPALRVRMGLNAGEALQEEQDFFGTAVILAARVMAKAQAGQILVSELFRRLVGTTASVAFVDRGQHELPGFEEPQRLYEVDWRAAETK